VADRVARFLEDAKAEILDALAHYNQRTPGAGDRLLEDVLETADRICEAPLRFPVEDDGYRRWRLLVFPYVLRYDIAPDGDIDIIAVAHAKREPGTFTAEPSERRRSRPSTVSVSRCSAASRASRLRCAPPVALRATLDPACAP
jgi:plasmid stabilization system protein ParE